MDFQQQSHRYMRPPPPLPQSAPLSMSDPYLQQPTPQPGPWAPSPQFQYHHHPQYSPSPPPTQWAPLLPPHSDYHAPPPPPYPASAYPSLHNPHQYPSPPLPPRPPQSYPHVNQDWRPNWGDQGWREHPAHTDEEDWASKARAWASAKATTDNSQHAQSQFPPDARLERPSHYHDQYIQNVDHHYPDIQQPLHSSSSYEQYPNPAAPTYRMPVSHPQESASFSSGYVPDGHMIYTARDGTFAATLPHQESSPIRLSVHQQEVPSSYSSVAGKEEARDQNDKFYKSLAFPTASTQQHYLQPPVPAVNRSLVEQPHFTADLSDQPLDFGPRFSRDHDTHLQSTYTHDAGEAVRSTDSFSSMSSVHAWTTAVPGVVYPSVPPVLSAGPQVEAAITSPVPGHSVPMFGMISGASFPPTTSSVSAPFGIGAGTVLHPTTAFPGDAYGASGVSERPKRGSVPNWLREQVIKAVITSSAPEISKDESKSIEDEGIYKSFRKGDQADSKSIDSSRSTEEDEDDEDYAEAARTAAINQEIKRVLTEILLKVTDELFDEIATKVLSEEDLTVEVNHNGAASNHKVSPSSPAVPTPKASAKVLIPIRRKEIESDDVGDKSTSNPPGDVLGLANYASDDDEDDAIQSSILPNSKGSTVRQQPNSNKLSDDLVENGSSQAETGERGNHWIAVESGHNRGSPNGTPVNHSAVISDLSDTKAGKVANEDLLSRYSSKTTSRAAEGETTIDDQKVLDGSDVSRSMGRVGQKPVTGTELPVDSFKFKKSISDDSQDRENRNKSDKNDRSEIKKSSAGKDFVKEAESSMDRTHGKGDEYRRRQDERHARKERSDDRNGSKEKMKEQGVKSGEKVKDPESRKRSHLDDKEDRKDTHKERRASAKEGDDRKRERTNDEKGEKSRYKLASESSRHKRRSSSSVGSRGRNSKDNALVNHGNDSSDGSSDNSRRKLHSERRKLSPSPVRSRRRQVSRSPHSKHSERRHSPYSSLETTRGRRSRSRSPIRRQR